MNNVILVFSEVVLLIAAFGAVVPGNRDILDSDGALALTYVGEADGKVYFYEINVYKNWSNAGLYCQSFGMHLATIQTESQLELLKSYHFPDAFFWTAGREANDVRQFTWNDTDLTFPGFLNDEFHNFPNEPTSCVAIFIFNSTFNMQAEFCVLEHSTLCST